MYNIFNNRAKEKPQTVLGYKFISYIYNKLKKIKCMPEILRLFGLRFYIYTRDHQPPHIHVVSQDGTAKFAITDTIKLIDNAGMKSKDLKLAESVIEDNRENILKEWVKIHGE